MTFRVPFFMTGGLLCALTLACPALASDHADTAGNVNRPGADMADVYIFPSPGHINNVVLVMNVHPLIPAGQGLATSFDPNVLYQIKMDTSGDFIEDLVIQARFSGNGPTQRAVISGPYQPYTTGTTAVFAKPYSVTGAINTTFSPAPGITVFTGGRSDPFFFDLERFFQILPDRATPGTGKQVDDPDGIMGADNPKANGFRGFKIGSGFDTTPANDILASFNVLSIVVELPRSMLGGKMIRVWETTSVLGGAPSFNFIQQDRLARPAVNEVLATVTANRHLLNNQVNPVQDGSFVKNDIISFMTFPARRSPETASTLATVLTPDVMVADLSQMTTKAAYLGVETGGFTGSKFGGRALTDDIVDIDLGAIFGNTLAALGLVADDKKELAQFTTDNITAHTDYLPTFPYLGAPH